MPHRDEPQGDPVYPTYPLDFYGQPQGYPQQGYQQQGYQPYGYPQYANAQGYGQYGNQGGYPAYHHPYAYAYGAPYGQEPAKTRNRGLLAGLVALVVAAAVVFAAVGFATHVNHTNLAGQGTAIPGNSSTGGSGIGGSNSGGSNGGGSGSGGTGSTNTGSGNSGANSTQQIGVVTIVSVLKYQEAESAGTGTILTSNGEILTNNHVVNGATSITVTVQSTGRSYKASVVGTAPTKDIAVLQLKNASGLTTANYASTASGISTGDAVTGVGNAGGTGSLSAASGKVVALKQSITATDETGADAERLHGLIEINAPIISGDSGGPLYDSAGQMIGIDTAASSNTSTTTRAYAITIDNAMSVAKQIETGVETTTIHIGLPGFLGIAPENVSGRVVIGQRGVEAGLPAAKAGITPGSTITSVGGTAITSTTQLHNLLAAAGPGDKVSVAWTDAQGKSHTAIVTLATGPAD